MKKVALFLTTLCSIIFAFAQGEFRQHDNGLMYHDTTMQQLEFIVDSLNLKYKSCDLFKTYYTIPQAQAHYVKLDTGDIKQAKADMEANMSFADFVKKYPNSDLEKDLLVIKFTYLTYDDEEIVKFKNLGLGDGYGHSISFTDQPGRYEQEVKGEWLIDYSEKTDYRDESIRAYFFTTEFHRDPLAENYARMVLYTDCMIDTTSQVFKEGAERTGWRYQEESADSIPSAISMLGRYIHEKTDFPERGEEDGETYWRRYTIWDSLKFERIDQELAGKPTFQALLKNAAEEALKEGGSSDDLEAYISRYYDKNIALELKRGRIVVGGCSMDDSPRIHAQNIAILSAEAVNWEVFLRAHLDIMNDRFERVSDGSYAWAGRKTYIRELEALDINVTDLLLGISLRIDNPSQNHYFGSIGRLGRALAETKYADEVENKMLEMIADETLDDYNRVLIYFLFLNYNHHIADENEQQANIEQLKKAVAVMPAYLSEKITFD